MSQPPGKNVDHGTDPGRPHPYESLYRAPVGDTEPPLRPTPRHFEPALSPPEGADTGFGWLFRSEPPAPAGEVRPAADITTTERPVVPPVGASPEAVSPKAVPPEAVPPKRRRVRFVVLMIVLLSVIAGIAVGAFVLRDRSRTDAAPTTSASSDAPSPDGPYAGRVGAVAADQARADCQAPAASDDGGNVVSYLPADMIDDNASTAWRCNGSAVDQTATFTLPADTRIAELGLINGYAKTDPTSGAARYGEYRRITEVRWTFDDGSVVPQKLTDGEPGIQRVRILPTVSRQVGLTIVSTTDPGSKLTSRDATLISEVTFAAVA